MADSFTKDKRVFLSYCHRNCEQAEEVDKLFRKFGVHVALDERDVPLSGSFSKFMDSINEYDYCIALLSDDYLKSRYCINEFLEVKKEKEHWGKIFVIYIGPIQNQSTYISYWEKQKETIEEEFNQLSAIYSSSVSKELQQINRITSEIGDLVFEINDHRYLPFHMLETKADEILEKIGYPSDNVRKEISRNITIKSDEERELDLERIKIRYSQNYSVWLYAAESEFELKNYLKADVYFQKAIELSTNNCYVHCQYAVFLMKIDRKLETAYEHLQIAGKIKENCDELMLLFGNYFIDKKHNFEEGFLYMENCLKAKPDKLRGLIYYARALIKKNKFEQAQTNYLKALSIEPDNSSLILEYAEFLHDSLKDTKQAYEYIKQAEKNNINNEYIYITLGRLVAKDKGKMEEIRILYNKAVKINSSLAYLHNEFGRIFAHDYNDAKSAKICFNKAIKLDEKYVSPYLGLSDIYEEQQKIDLAIKVLKGALDKIKDHKCLHCYLAQKYYKKGDYKKAEVHYQAEMNIGSLDKDLYNLYGYLLLYKLDKPKEAKEIYYKSIQIDNSDFDVIKSYLQACKKDNGDYRDLESIVNGIDNTTFTDVKEYNELGWILLYECSKLDYAEKILLIAIEIDAKNTYPFNLLLNINSNKEINNSSFNYIIEKIRNATFTTSEEVDSLAVRLFYMSIDNDLVRNLLRRSIEIDPMYASSYNNLGYLLLHKYNEIEEARKLLSKSIELDKTLALGYSNLAEINYTYDKDYESAKKLVKKAYKLDPNDSLIIETYNKIFHN